MKVLQNLNIKSSGLKAWTVSNTPILEACAGRIRSIEKFNDLIGIRTHDLPACSIVPQQL
jgi:hypothetical protein